MKKVRKLLAAVAVLLFVLSCQSVEVAPDARDIVFKDINLISMTGEEIQENQSVYVSNGIIVEIGPYDELTLPPETAVINGKDKYLLPGFSDMHVHTHYEEDLALFLANGITTIRNMWGAPEHLWAREAISNGELLGPNLYTAGPLTEGEVSYWDGSYILTDPEEVETYVTSLKNDGYDYVKVYNGLSEEVFFRIMETANALDIPVIGHVPDGVLTEDALRLGMQSIEHFEGYEYWQSLNDLSDLIDLSVETGVWNCPTLAVMESYTKLMSRDSHPEDFTQESIPELRYANPYNLYSWLNYFEGWDMYMPGAQVLLDVLYDEGANIVSGTDQGNPYLIPGFSLHREFELMNDSGLTPYEVLLTTTVNPAVMLGMEDRAGTIEPGKIADLVLLEENPLEDISNTRTIAGTMTRGRWLSRTALDNMLEEVAITYASMELEYDEEEYEETDTQVDQRYTIKEKTEVLNGDFSQGDAEWATDNAEGGVASFNVVDEVMVVHIESPGYYNWSVGMYSVNIPLVMNDTVRVTFDVKADADTVIASSMGLADSPWTIYVESGDLAVSGGADWQTMTYQYTAELDVPAIQLAFALGASSATTIYLDNVVVEVLD